ncbi:hypothetical protein SAMN04487985_10123 [Aerococcus urinaehominis]|uniref:DUF2075 domain-containing protein n=1 Tax=Aerococcus urinaehominis TaxID=128944 RepID=UPI00088B5760|nr:hypothetical protein SAMN04487985_10123 [Aerococcus urinaehominis]
MVRDSAIFKASPFHKLTDEQLAAQLEILTAIEQVQAKQSSQGQLILVEGEAGSGKTVLMSSLFYQLFQAALDEDRPFNSYLLVNHDQQVKVYQEIAYRLDINKERKGKFVSKPTAFINGNNPDQPVDVVIVDEAHLLWTQGKQSYQGENQLLDLIERAKLVVAVFDKQQIMSTEQYLQDKDITAMEDYARENGKLIELKNQMRINANAETVAWIRALVDEQIIDPIPEDDHYELKIFENPCDLEAAIKVKAQDQDRGISRVIATYDWPYIGGNPPENQDQWMVEIGYTDAHGNHLTWAKPWNYQVKNKKRGTGHLSWAEQEQTINEVGSTFSVQGFDLNYAGLIIGPSVKYRNGRLVFDPSASKNKKATRNRTIDKVNKISVNPAEELLRNELNVLITRGVNGLYIYAVDDQLRSALLEAAKQQRPL